MIIACGNVVQALIKVLFWKKKKKKSFSVFFLINKQMYALSCPSIKMYPIKGAILKILSCTVIWWKTDRQTDAFPRIYTEYLSGKALKGKEFPSLENEPHLLFTHETEWIEKWIKLCPTGGCGYIGRLSDFEV